MAEIKVKAVIDKEKNKVVLVECNADFVDVLFSFLTMPMATIIRLTSEQLSPIIIGSMNNLYKSVENFSEKCFRTSECRNMLLSPRNGAEAYLKNLKQKLEDHSHFFCTDATCTSALKLMSYHKHTLCPCGKYLDLSLCLNSGDDGGVFVKGSTRYMISDDLLIFPLSTTASFSLLLKQDIITVNAIEEIDFFLEKNEILNLLKNLFVSKDPLTETLLNNSAINEPSKEIFDHRRVTKKRKITPSSGDEQHFSVKLVLSKSRDVVCFAVASEGFIDLLFSFLTVPLGKIMKEYGGTGCAHHLHGSVEKLDGTNLISDEIRQFLLSPKVALHYGIHNNLLGVDETVNQYFCTVQESNTIVNADKSRLENLHSSYGVQELTILDPKSSYDNKGNKTSGGFVKEATMFTITDDLVIKASSAILGVTILDKMNVPFSDTEERTVNVGKEEAISLLVASFISKSPLNDVFIRKIPKEQH